MQYNAVHNYRAEGSSLARSLLFIYIANGMAQAQDYALIIVQ